MRARVRACASIATRTVRCSAWHVWWAAYSRRSGSSSCGPELAALPVQRQKPGIGIAGLLFGRRVARLVRGSHRGQCAADAAALESPPPARSGRVIQISAMSTTNTNDDK
ncbi:hypothetical protein Busp01_46770 [Trinickia caryophylli]|nr:hypothetical protein Busp01_46770 [Trinickia caryophylli]